MMLSNSERPSGKMVPWAALLLLLSAYALLGIYLANLPVVWLNWAMAIVGAFLVTIMFSRPQLGIERWLSRGLRSDLFAFALLVVSAALVSVILLWLHIFLKMIAILSSAALVRLELGQNNFGVDSSFWILMVSALLGLGLTHILQQSQQVKGRGLTRISNPRSSASFRCF